MFIFGPVLLISTLLLIISMVKMAKEKVVLVDRNDKQLGEMEKMEAHVKGVLHRAFSIFVFNEKGEMMLQRRALSKYHSPGLWTNTCCSHPRMNEAPEEAIHRRLVEEMGFDTDLKKAFDFVYKSDVGQGLIEHEFDHVFFGQYDGEPKINPDEVEEWKFMSIDDVALDIKESPDDYTVWFKIAFGQLIEYLKTT